MPKLLKKVIFSFILFLVIFSSFIPNILLVRAQDQSSTWYNQGFTEWYTKVFDTENPSEIFGERYTAAQVQWVVWGLLSMPLNFLGKDNQEIINCFLKGVGGEKQSIFECATGAVNAAENLFKLLIPNLASSDNTSFFAMVFDTSGRSVSGIKYTKETLSKLSLVPEAKAQGFGYGALDALKQYWGGFRNIAYSLIVLVTIVFAFMIMFRVKISPQVVISVQSALPKILWAVVLATFSYAIAGFMIDLMYVVGGLFASLMDVAGFINATDAFAAIVPVQGNSTLGNFYIFGWMFAYSILFIFAAVWSIVVALTNFSLWGILASVVLLVLIVWVVILMFVYLVKIPWILLKNLVSIYLSIVIAPIQIVAGVLIPSIGFGQWLKKLASELLVFPVTGLFLLLANLTLLNSFAVNANNILGKIPEWAGLNVPGRLWSPPIIGDADDMSGLLWVVVSLMFVFMIPKVVDLLKSLIMGEKFSFGTAIGEAVGPLRAGWGMTGAPILTSFQQAAGRSTIASTQEEVKAWFQRRNLPEWFKKIVQAYPGKE